MGVRTWLDRLWKSQRTVQQDWLAALPEAKLRLFEKVFTELETHYVMLSVALNEALGLRSRGALAWAREQAAISGALVGLFAERLLGTLRALEDSSRHFANLPLVTSLKPDHFRGMDAQMAASWSQLYHHALFSGRLRFFHKLGALIRLVEELARQYRMTVEEIASGASTNPARDWTRLDHAHYDLNTCLRETIVLVKSFLCVLPPQEVPQFEARLCEWVEGPVPARTCGLRPGRALEFQRE
ncbi:MAG: hypothetical protein K6U02_10085 [Firmicutes bacterium]|nr:hypothetical protein [Bacillota bacterium]